MLQVLSGKLGGDDAEEVWLAACNASFAAMIRDKQSREAEEAKATVSIHLASARLTMPPLSGCHVLL